MRQFLYIILFFSITPLLKAQYGNEWINTSQKYYKFPVTKEGIYRIDSATLAQRYNLSNVNPKNFQLFFGGKEQFLFINGEADNKINFGDYLEFYLNPQKVNANIDSLIYSQINYLPNPYKAIFNDTVYAFLTLNTSTSNKRFVLETDTTWANYSPTNYFYSEKIVSLPNTYNFVKEYSYDISDPRYTQAEGWGFALAKGNSIASAFGNLNSYTTTSLPCFLTVNFSGNSKVNNFSLDHKISITYNTIFGSTITLLDTAFNGFLPVRRTYPLNSQTIGNSTSILVNSIASPSFSAFNNSTIVHYINLFYPQTLNLNNQAFYKLFSDDNANTAKGYFNFSNVNTSGSTKAIVYDVTNGKRFLNAVQGNNVKVIIPNSGTRKLCLLASESQTMGITALSAANQNNPFSNFKNTFATKPYVIIYHNNTQSGAMAYKTFRESINGGSYNVIAANINELYEQFAYGINKHPAAIKNFLRYLKDSLTNVPQYVFLIGKGIKNEDLVASFQSQNLIPTMGIPSSDNLLSASMSIADTNYFSPDIPIGRLAALSNAEVTDYLSKVQQHANAAPAPWKKRVLHFVGGDTEDFTNTLNAYMDGYAQIIADTSFGGDTLTFRKNTTAPIQQNISDSVKSCISNGAAIINFFGHGSEQGFDQAIDDPEEYNNTGKYPFVIANSCYSGNIHVFGRRSVSDRFVFSKQKGSIGFLSAASLGFPYALNKYTTFFYKALAKTKYNYGVGDFVKEACMQAGNSIDPITKFTCLDIALHGDPAIKLSNGLLPDYTIKNSDVTFNTKTYVDSIGIKISITNLGRALKDSFFVKIGRYFPNGDSSVILKRFNAPYFKDSLKFFTPTDFNRGIGLNKFKIIIDNFNEINEATKSNNNTIGTIDLFISGGDIVPVYPYKYAIVPKTTTLTLKASTSDPFGSLTTYRFQLDTCDKFTAPLQTKIISSTGGVLEWLVNLPYSDSTVYFWRVSKDSTSPSSPYFWRESSFQTIGNKRGWSQAHFNQFKNNGYQFVKYKSQQRKFLFENNKHSIACRNGIYPNIADVSINFFYNNSTLSSWGCAPNGWNIAVFDSISGKPDEVISVNWPASGPGTYSNCVCVDNQVLYVYSFGSGNYCGFTNWQTSLENFLNAIPTNNYVLAYTLQNAQKSSYSSSLYTAFDAIGLNTIRTTSDTLPYILFGKKGNPLYSHEVKGNLTSSIITFKDTITTRWNKGYVASEIIGPAYKWNSLHWRVQSLDAGLGDTTILKLVGINTTGQIDTLQTFIQDSSDIYDLGNYADAVNYPYLKLVTFMKDNIYTTSPQLKRWQVIYDEAPECAINPLKGFESINDTLQEGDEVTFKFPIENIGVKNFEDSLLITYWIEDNARNKIQLPQKLKPKLFSPGQVLIDTVKINSYQFAGNNILWIYVNPLRNNKYQKEQYQFNNIGRFPFKVNKDITNPLLDVTFDGVRILNGDIVSAKPTILITLKDENQFLALNDTSAFTIFIQAPNQTLQQRIYFANALQFTPANLPKNSCSIRYNPTLYSDGKYTLVVQAKDRSKNASGSQNYRIQFEVNNKPTITNVLNYPNPFSSSTKFVFTLTGSEIPEVFTIQIMTITGKIVREITRSELGNLRIGRNISDYAWDGRDNFGSKLANGVYLYKIITKLNGSDIEKSSTSADKFFVKDFGKMVLMR